MTKIQYSRELLVDFNKLVLHFGGFMSLGLIHADQNLEPKCQAKMRELINYSLESSRRFQDFFKLPVLSHEEENKEKLMKNLESVIKFCYPYLAYAESVLKKCRPDLHKGEGFTALRKRYLEFYAKYFS